MKIQSINKGNTCLILSVEKMNQHAFVCFLSFCLIKPARILHVVSLFAFCILYIFFFSLDSFFNTETGNGRKGIKYTKCI